jgi:hypothetical protein
MTSFIVHGPFKLSYEQRGGGRTLKFEEFWDKEPKALRLSNKTGCYIFAMRNRALIPIYVGKATKSFKQEAFNPSNKHKYHDGFSQYARGTPVMYFVVHPDQKGRINVNQIGKVEEFLIQAGAARNPDIQNVKGKKRPKWKIKGVIRSGVGKRSAAETDLRKLFDIH